MRLISMLFAVSTMCPASLLAAQNAAQPAAPAQAETQSAPEQPLESKPGSGITPPKVIHAVDPEYTDKARRKKLSGTCELIVTVGVDGLPRDVKVSRSMSEQLPAKLHDAAVSLDENAIKAVEQYRFEPAMLHGRPVPVYVHIEVKFQIYR